MTHIRIDLPAKFDPPPGRRSTSLQIRNVTSNDVALLSERLATIEPWPLYPFTASAFAASFTKTDPGAQRYALFCDDQLAGASIVRPLWLRGPYLQFLTIFPEFQNNGIAYTFLKWLEADAVKAGHKNLWVATSDFNTKAERFYRRFGFEPAARFDDLVKEGVNEILLRKKI